MEAAEKTFQISEVNLQNIIYDINQIREYLPHRAPFLFIDRVVYFEDGVRIVAVKNVTMNEPYFPGHFPERPVMPGVIILESLAQAGCMLAKASQNGGVGREAYLYLVGADDFRWKKPVVPGDTLLLNVWLDKRKGPLLKMASEAYVQGQIVASGSFTAVRA